MLTPREIAAIRQAVEHPDDSVAQVVADSLVERGVLLGSLMQAAMQKPRDLPRERALAKTVLEALQESGLGWARQVVFTRGLPVAAQGGAERFARLSTSDTLQWPLDELWLDATDPGTFYEALRSPVMEQITRLTFEGSVSSRYSLFVDGAPDTLRVLPGLTRFEPPMGEMPLHWRPVIMPAFTKVKVLCVSANVEVDLWLDALPSLEKIELRVLESHDPYFVEAPAGDAWNAGLFTAARGRDLPIFAEGRIVESTEQLAERGLLRSNTILEGENEVFLPGLEGESEAGSAEQFIESFDGRQVVVSTPKLEGQSWAAQSWRRELYRDIEALRLGEPMSGVARIASAAASSARTKITLQHAVRPLEVTLETVDAMVAKLRHALRDLVSRGFVLPAITRDMLFMRDGQLELLPLFDRPVSEDWRSDQRIVGLQLLPEHVRTLHGVDLLVASVEREWRAGQPLAPTAFNELSMRRAWRLPPVSSPSG